MANTERRWRCNERAWVLTIVIWVSSGTWHNEAAKAFSWRCIFYELTRCNSRLALWCQLLTFGTRTDFFCRSAFLCDRIAFFTLFILSFISYWAQLSALSLRWALRHRVRIHRRRVWVGMGCMRLPRCLSYVQVQPALKVFMTAKTRMPHQDCRRILLPYVSYFLLFELVFTSGCVYELFLWTH